MASGAYGFMQTRQIGILIGFVSQEVKHSAVMPEGNLLTEMQLAHVRDKPLYLDRPRTQASPDRAQCRLGDVNYGQILEATLKKLIDKG